MSASASTICGPLPPSSSTRFRSPASRATSSPVSTEPVKTTAADVRVAHQRDAGLAASVDEVDGPGGKPASAKISTNSSAHSGACSDGFQTAVQPSASP